MCNLYNVFVQLYTFQLTFQNVTSIFLHGSITEKVMASGTPSAQVRIPLTGPLLPPPRLLTLYFLGENHPAAAEKVSDGVKTMRRQNNYPAAE